MKTTCIVYYDRWHGWSFSYNGGLIRVGFLPDLHKSLVDYYNTHCKRQEFTIGFRGWEL